ncbi:HD family phosphohydrolase [Verrucomicrobiota bacterium sgz303538]
MFDLFERKRLVKRGLASAKVRRRRTESELLQSLEHGIPAKLVLFFTFVLGLWALIYSDYRQQPMEKVFIGMLIFLVALAQLWINHPNTWDKNSRLLLIFGVLLLHLAVVKAVLVTSDSQALKPGVVFPGELSKLDKQILWRLAVPYALAPLTLSVLLGRNLGIYAAIFASLWSFVVYRGSDAKLLVMSLICGFVAVFVTLDVRRRSRLLRAGLFVGLATWVLAMVFGIIGPIIWEAPANTHWKMIGYQSLIAIGSGLATALLVGGALPLLESLFRITTNMSWLELADLNHPLLKRMTIEAPGTYHHSLVVAHLAEAAAEAIGANPAMSRVCSLFHDIGKLVKPEYFTENMRHGRNPHDELAPTMSALIIIAHVKEGVDLALKHGLNQQIIDTIQQHHGTSLVYYFYKRALQQQEDARQGGKIMNIREEDIPDVREESFRYPGPKPQTKECAIISLADSIESASRSLEKVNPQKLDQLVDDIMEKRLMDGQLKECELSMRELEEVAESFKHTLHSMMHARVAYPTDRKETLTPSLKSNVPPVSAA